MNRLLDDLRRLPADPRLVPVAAVAGVLAVAGFWLLVVVGAAQQPGYDHTRDYVSALAGTGVERPWLGAGALVLFGGAYLAAGHVLLWHLRQALAAVLVVGAGLVTLLVAAARVDCREGGARCGLSADPVAYVERVDDASWGQVVHGPAVAVSFALALAAMVVLAVRPGVRVTRAVSAVTAAAAALTPALWLPSDQPGLGQRVWLGALSAWILWVCLTPLLLRRPDADERPALG